VARQRGAAAAGEELESVVEPLGDLRDREHSRPRGRKLDGERNAVETPADVGHGAPLVVRPRGVL
jgi:hypothetical protein